MFYVFHHGVKGVPQSFSFTIRRETLKTPCYSVSSVVKFHHLMFMTMSWEGIAYRSQFHMISSLYHDLVA